MKFSDISLKPHLYRFKNRLSGLMNRDSSTPPSLPAPIQQAVNEQTGTVFVIEFPYDEVGFPIEYYSGWCYTRKKTADITITANGKPVYLYALNRPDLQGLEYRGFSIYFQLHRYLDVVKDGSITFTLCIDGSPEAELGFRIAPYIIEPAERLTNERAKRKEFLYTILECPQCHRAKPEHQGDKELVCPQCSTHYPQHQGEADWDGITMLHGPIEEETRLISKTDPVSTHVYPPYLVERINHYARVGGWVLDVGAGLRRQTFPNLVCVEIFDYPSSDVRSTGDSLPFADNSFDYVISNAVLEHVPHPFRDASELLRVLKPGGEMHVMVPFLQPEHGYPHHYFNMTRSGLLQLFGDAIEVESHTLDHSNEPIFSLSWFLSVYLSCLPKQEHDNFLNMKVKDFVFIPPQEYLTKPIVTSLSNQGRWTLATGHTLMARKKPVSG